jgi:endoglucanase
MSAKDAVATVERTREETARALAWLLEIASIPTAAGREWRVVDWLRAWTAARPDLRLVEDAAGNVTIEPRKRWGKGRKGARDGAGGGPVLITAHLDHPAFVVERVIGPGTLECSFRGGVNDDYFPGARVVVLTGSPAGENGTRPERRLVGSIAGEGDGVNAPDGSRLFKTYLVELGDDAGDDAPVRVGDVGVWDLPPSEIDEIGLVHAPACDDLAALAAAVSAFETLRGLAAGGERVEDVRLLFTRSEEIGFTGAIAACKLGTIPAGARVIALENSRSFPDSPIGAGPIVRVGDRMSVFDPRLTAACAKRAEQIAGHAATPRASEKTADVAKGWKWQRKLMAGGACEATVFCAYGHAATCLCLPLGNYHNMAELQAVQDGTYDKSKGPPRIAREFIHRDDYLGMVDLLVAIGRDLPAADPAMARIEGLWAKTKGVLGRDVEGASTVRSRSGSRTAPAPKGTAAKRTSTKKTATGKAPAAKPRPAAPAAPARKATRR